MSDFADLEKRLIAQARADGVERLVIGAVVNNGSGSLLMVRRVADDFLGGLFEFPGGAVDEGETLLAATARELYEETGLRLSNVQRYIDTFDYRSGSGKLCRQFNFAVDVASDDIKLNPTEHDQYIWISKTQIGTIALSDCMRVCALNYWDTYPEPVR
jgi:8-oxo-dGTP diphosphatase